MAFAQDLMYPTNNPTGFAMEYQELTPECLLGALNDVEQKFAPDLLYVSGSTDYLKHGPRVSIVGARKASPEGVARARRLANLLTSHDAVVVSGLAEGIDVAGHSAAIEANGRTIAVLGTPLDKVYPRTHAELQEQIMNEHLCVSQFPFGYPTSPACFPMRNRTMALLSDATVIIEAGDKSGSISQAWEALRLGRGLFITKTLVDNSELTWPDKLIEYGAKVLSDETIRDFLDFLPPRLLTDLDSVSAF